MADSPADQDLADRYRAYLALCNAHAFDQIGAYVAENVVVNDSVRGLAAYISGLRAVVASFPDYHWDLRRLVVNRPLAAAQLVDTGTHTGADFLGVPAGDRRVRVPEFAVYAWSGGLIQEVWTATDRLDVLEQLREEG